ncbi:MAG: sugar-binding protein, partial [Armatimonadota bacterium]
MRKLIVFLMAGLTAVAVASVPVDSFDANTGFTLAKQIEKAVPETKEGRQALHMHVPCEGEGVVYIGQRFEPLQDWTGYCRLHFNLFASTTGEASHIQVQIFDRQNNQVRLRRALKPHHLGKWREITWNFKNEEPEDKPVDFSNIKLLLISCWQDYYGHTQGDVVDYWIADMRRERCFGSAALGAAPIASAPTLDGSLDDGCWESAPMTEQFYRRGEGVPARENTSVQACWDDENLYLGVRASAEVLDPRLQRLNEFRAAETEHDGRVYGDDAIEVFLGPAEDRTAYYHFAVNALATKYEGAQTDKSWDGEWSAASETYDGYWVTEIAIPWESVGFGPDPGGMMWANVCRNNMAQDELSTWSPVSGGFHAPDEFGSFMLLPQSPVAAVRSGTMPRLLIGRNVVAPQVQGLQDGDINLRLMLQQDSSETIQRQTVEVSSDETKEVELPAVIEDPGAVGASYSALDPATDLFYFQTPMVTFETAAVERLMMSLDGTATV